MMITDDRLLTFSELRTRVRLCVLSLRVTLTSHSGTAATVFRITLALIINLLNGSRRFDT